MQRPATERTSSRQDWWWIFDPSLSLRAWAALTIGGGALLFTLLLGWAASTLLRRHLENQLGPTFETLAFQISDKLDRSFYERVRELQFSAGLPPLRTPGTAPAERRRLLDSILDASPDLAWVGFVDLNGKIVSATQGLLENTSVAETAWFRGAREKPSAGSVHEMPDFARRLQDSGDETASRFVEIAVPVTNPEGRQIGVLAALVRWSTARAIQLSVVPEAATRERLGVTIYALSGDVWLDSGGTGWTAPPAPPAVPDAKRFRGSMTEAQTSGPPYLTGYARGRGFRDFRGLGWLVTVRQPVADAFAGVRTLQRSMAIWGFLVAGVFTAAAWWSAGKLARRLTAVATAARRIRHGDVLTVIPLQHGDSEIEKMCGAVGELVEDFRRKEEKVAAAQPKGPDNRPY